MPAPADSRISVLEGLRLPDRYSIRRSIAEGGMASVWCAHDRALSRNVAIKLLSERFAHDSAAIRRFSREARTAARLSSHRHVVTIYDIGNAIHRDAPFGRPFIVMEYLAGGTVADALRVGAVTRELALNWLEHAASALDYAHERGVVHRDIKPANLLLDCERTLHVADFGIARRATEETFTGTGELLGTAAYIAPEQVLGRPATAASDRYALAVAAFELLVGSRPFTAENLTVQARQHLQDDPPLASSVNESLPAALDAVLARGMEKQPERRWSSCREFADAVASALGRQPKPLAISTRPRLHRPTNPPSSPPARRERRGLAVAALAAALGVGVAAMASGSLGSSSAGSSHALARTAAHHHRRAPRRHGHGLRTHPKAQLPGTTVTAAPAAATTPPPNADTLEAHGHALLQGGDYAAAIPVLRNALSDAAPTSLTYAYALFDLGRALRLAGDPQAAVRVLYRRLQIPNQTGVVRAELQLALRELGGQAHPHH